MKRGLGSPRPSLFSGSSLIPHTQLVTGGGGIGLFRLSRLFGLFRLFRLSGLSRQFRLGPIPEGFGLRGVLAASLGRPKLRFRREGFPQVQIVENRSASAKPLRETPSPCDHLPPHCRRHHLEGPDGRSRHGLWPDWAITRPGFGEQEVGGRRVPPTGFKGAPIGVIAMAGPGHGSRIRKIRGRAG